MDNHTCQCVYKSLISI
ncbi:MAG: hypothetical protein D6711_03285 [Chloroflexi bacterium]|nr:MAG: hypothetical protein D6711_03285 [Chloroflexota bacterium]